MTRHYATSTSSGEQMTRHYDELAEVEFGWVDNDTGGAEGPTHILWRGRLYRVREVLAHWVESGPWWQSTVIRSLHDGVAPTSGEIAQQQASDTLLDTCWDIAEHDVWRVEAQAGRSAPRIVLDISLDAVTGHWVVLRTHD
jgi:hypothetical protein